MIANHYVQPAPARSLLGSLRDGSAGVATRLVVSVALGLLLSGVASVASYILSAMNPRTYVNNGVQYSYIRVSDEVVAVCFLVGGAVYLGMLYAIWSRHRGQRGIWLAGIFTVGIWTLAILLSILVDQSFTGEDEFLIAGVICTASAATLVTWLLLYQRHSRGRSLYNTTGQLDLRCPVCQYSLVGLKEARCPECGQEFTLDELVGKQDFEALRTGRSVFRRPLSVPEVPPLPPQV